MIVENSHIHTNSDLGQVNTFFTSTEEGGWEDLSASGCKCLSTIKIIFLWNVIAFHTYEYSKLIDLIFADLLSNAFRTSSTKAPDALPSVKKWKAFAKEIEVLKLASSKKNKEKIISAYESASEKLDSYLDAVELPSGMELKQM